MPLNKTELAADIKAALDAESDKDVDPAEARERQSTALANAIDKYIKAGTVQTTLTGTSATGGPITGTGTGGIT
jgi:hypothetical protein